MLARNVEAFSATGYRDERRGALAARLVADGRLPLALRMNPEGRIFGGSFALEIATAEPVLPRTRGLRARPRGVVRLTGVSFAARRGDEAGERLAARLATDERLSRALADVHFERVRIDPDGRAVIRHMGGSVVWVLFPPLVRAVPLVRAQAEASADALAAFAAVGS
jgi:hypothetical protein